MKNYITIILGVLLIGGGLFAAKTVVDSNQKPKPVEKKVVQSVFVKTVKNGDIPISIYESGRLMAKNRMEVYSEVQGVMEATRKEFKPGSRYKKGETMVRVRSNDYYANLQAQKSVLQNLIASIIPDLRLDYPDAYKKWEKYLQNFDMDKPIADLPKTTSDKEKYFVTGKNIYTTYYNTKNLEIILQKYNLTAPFDGILTDAVVNPGTVVRQGQRLGEFIDPTVYELAVSVAKSILPSLSVGKQVEVSDSKDKMKTWQGTIARINGKVDATTQTVQVFIDLRGKDLKEGMYLQAKIDGEAKSNAMEISRNLIIDESNVYVVKDGALELAPIRILHENQKTVIIAGLKDGMQMVSKVVPNSFSGMAVSIING
ncbi:MAG: efflux RND transporter periplasmic adaptor subunit [Cyclobacteriaceae bacterium]